MSYPWDFTGWFVSLVLILAGCLISGNVLVILLVGLGWGLLWATAICRIRKEVLR